MRNVNATRSLIFEGSIPLSITLAESDIPNNAPRLVDRYYVRSCLRFVAAKAHLMASGQQIQAARSSYLPLLLPSIRTHLLDLTLSSDASMESNTKAADTEIKDEDVWFDYDGVTLRW